MLAIPTLMATLAQQRPVFHAEADFQHAFAWEIHRALPDAQVRLEWPTVFNGKRLHVDIWVTWQGQAAAIELKYVPRNFDAQVDGETFALRSQYAEGPRRYNFIADIVRLESVVARYPNVIGYAILLTNDPRFWTPAAGTTIFEAFRLHEGRELTGTLAWGAKAGAGTTKGNSDPLTLAGHYPLHWTPYAQVGAGRYGELRYVAVEVRAS